MFLLFYHNEKTIGDNMRERTGIQLCYPFEERRILDPKFGWIWPVLVQPKLDGERMRALCSGILHDPLLLSSTESNIVSVPHIKKELSELRTFMEFDGELYQHGTDFNKIQSKVGRSVYLHSEHKEISYHVFDIISDQMQINRTTILERFFSDREFQYLKLVPSELCYDMNQIMDIYKKYLSEGYEGIIIRHIHANYERKRSRFIMKFKPKKTDIYQIVEIIEGTGDHAGMVGAFRCQGNDATTFKVAAGEFNHTERRYIWKNPEFIMNMLLEISYQNISAKGIPRFGLAKRIIEGTLEDEECYSGML